MRSGKIPTTSVRRRISVQPLLRIVGPDLAPQAFGEGREREDVLAGGFEVVRDLGQFLGQGVQDPVELGVHAGGVGLVIDRVEEGFHPWPGRFRRRGLPCCRGGRGQSSRPLREVLHFGLP